MASHNQLTGEIPRELAKLSDLQWLMLGNNGLHGEIPSELGELVQLEALNFQENQLTGQIPPELGNLSQLWSLNLDANQLSGPIPPELGKLSNLGSMDLNDNLLTGPIPTELGDLSELLVLDLSTNILSGQIPPELGNIPGLRALHLSANMLSGCIPVVLRRVQSHDLADLEIRYCDVLLGDLGIVPGELNQDFDPYFTRYTAMSDAATVTVTVIHEHGTTIRYLDNLSRTLPDADLETDGHQVNLGPGVTFVRVRAESGDLQANRTYTVLVANGGLFRGYDANDNRVIERDEVLRAVRDYFDGNLTRDEVVGMVQLYFFPQ